MLFGLESVIELDTNPVQILDGPAKKPGKYEKVIHVKKSLGLIWFYGIPATSGGLMVSKVD